MILPFFFITYIFIAGGVDNFFIHVIVFFAVIASGYFFQKFDFDNKNVKLYWAFAVIAVIINIIYATAGEWMKLTGSPGILLATYAFFSSMFIFPIFMIFSPAYFFIAGKEFLSQSKRGKFITSMIVLFWIFFMVLSFPARNFLMRILVDPCYREYTYDEEITTENPKFSIVGDRKCITDGARNWFGDSVRRNIE
ncbi:MAG: hypothetical protein WC823_04550 [Parcubacteria group bacterium]